MKKTKLLLMCFVAIFAGMCFTSCSDDKDDQYEWNEDYPLIGNWTYTEDGNDAYFKSEAGYPSEVKKRTFNILLNKNGELTIRVIYDVEFEDAADVKECIEYENEAKKLYPEYINYTFSTSGIKGVYTYTVKGTYVWNKSTSRADIAFDNKLNSNCYFQLNFSPDKSKMQLHYSSGQSFRVANYKYVEISKTYTRQ